MKNKESLAVLDGCGRIVEGNVGQGRREREKENGNNTLELYIG